VSTDASLPRPHLGLPQPRLAAEWLSTRDRRGWPAPPPGDGRPVVLVPGFLAGDASLARLAEWLRDGGWQPIRSGIAWNTDCLEPTVERLRDRIEDAVDEHGGPAVIIGQSRGGTVGRALAVLHPELVDSLVTLGSPHIDQLAVSGRTWASIGAVAALGTAGVPRMLSLRCLDGVCCARSRAALTAPFPESVAFVSLYSRRDEVVRWQSCLDPAADQLEISSSHVGMAFERSVWERLAAVLSV
jgi:pimeloyl-ACP methyl ester carboxylesterase